MPANSDVGQGVQYPTDSQLVFFGMGFINCQSTLKYLLSFVVFLGRYVQETDIAQRRSQERITWRKQPITNFYHLIRQWQGFVISLFTKELYYLSTEIRGLSELICLFGVLTLGLKHTEGFRVLLPAY